MLTKSAKVRQITTSDWLVFMDVEVVYCLPLMGACILLRQSRSMKNNCPVIDADTSSSMIRYLIWIREVGIIGNRDTVCLRMVVTVGYCYYINMIVNGIVSGV